MIDSTGSRNHIISGARHISSYTNSGQKRAVRTPENILTIRETCFDVNCYLTDTIDWKKESQTSLCEPRPLKAL